MLRLANQVIDAYDDVSRVGLQKIAHKNPSIYMMTPDEKARLCDTDYALSLITKKASKLNKYPVNDHDNTWLSNQYFDMFNHRLPEKAASIAAHHIKLACERFGVTPAPSVVGMAKEAESNLYYEDEKPLLPRAMIKTATLSELAEAEKIGENYTFAQYAFSSPGHVKLACQYFEKCAEKMPLDVRHKYAAAIQRRSAELGLGAQKGTVAKYASDHYSPLVDAHVRSRATLLEVSDPKTKMALDKLASMKKDMTPTAFAQTLFAFDKRAKLDRYYGSYLTNPFEATFAAEPDPYAGYRVKVANETLTAEEVRSLVGAKADKIKEYFGPTMLEELKKDPVAVFDSLPKDAQEIMVGFSDGTI